MPLRGEIGELPDGRLAMFDDNLSPTNAFLWAAGVSRSEVRDVQYKHVWSESGNRDAYKALWNVCVTSAFLAKTTDGSNHPEAVAALRYRAYDLYNFAPIGVSVPSKPAGYDELRWVSHPKPVANLERVLRGRLRSSPKSRTTIACREIGWLYSHWEPDATV